jgi:hypothetical protein
MIHESLLSDRQAGEGKRNLKCEQFNTFALRNTNVRLFRVSSFICHLVQINNYFVF